MSRHARRAALRERAEDLQAVAARLSVALALRNDHEFRRGLVLELGLSRTGPTIVFLDHDGPAWSVGSDHPLAADSRAAALAERKGPTLLERIAASPRLLSALRPSQHRAAELLQRLESLSPDQEAFELVAEHADVVGEPAYRTSARTTLALDELRPRLMRTLAVASPSEVRRYWDLAYGSAHLALIAAEGLRTSWFTDMATSFSWRAWTPSFPMIRERSLWLTLAGGRLAAAFGETLWERYVPFLSHDVPMRRFDAVAGLVSIALRKPPLARHVLARLERHLDPNAPPDPRLQHGLLASARAVLVDGRTRSFDPSDWSIDPAELDRHGSYPGILGLGSLVAAPRREFFAAAPRQGRVSIGQLSSVLRRAWGDLQPPPAQSRVLH